MKRWIQEEINYIKLINNYIRENQVILDDLTVGFEEDSANFIKKVQKYDKKRDKFEKQRLKFRKKWSEPIKSFVYHNFRSISEKLEAKKKTYFYYQVHDDGSIYFDIEEIRLQVGVALARHPDFNGELLDKVTQDAFNQIEQYLIHPDFEIKDLSFSDNYLTTEEVNCIFSIIKSENGKFLSLDISDNSLGGEIISVMKRTLSGDSYGLCRIDFHENNIPSSSIEEVKELISENPEIFFIWE